MVNFQNLGFQAYSGGTQYFALTAAMGTTPQVIKTASARLCKIVNPGAAQTATVSVYDTASNSSSGAQLLWSGVLAAAEVIDIQIPAVHGLMVSASVAVTGSVLLTWV